MTEGPYELPEGWRWVKLGEMCAKPQYGFTQSASQEPVGPKFLRITDITSGYIDWDKVPYCRADQRALEKYRLTVGDILFARSGSVGAVILIKEQPPVDAVFASYLIRVRVNQTVVLPEFVELLVKSNFGQSQLVPRGAAQKNINAKRLQQIIVPLPPLPEQRRIVARIEELMERVREAKRLREEAKKDADRLMQAALAEVFPRPGDPLPTDWKWVELGEVARREVKTIKPSDMPDHAFNYLGMEHVAPNQWEEPKPESRLGVEIRSSVIMFWPGLVLYGKLRPYLNKVIVPSTEGVGSTEFVPIKPDEKLLLPSFLGAFLRSPSFISYATSNTTGSRQPRIRMEALWNTLIPLPPLPEQRHIVAYLDQIQARVTALKKAQESTKAELHRLEQAIWRS